MATHSSIGQRSLVDCRPRGGKELDTTERLTRSLLSGPELVQDAFSLGWGGRGGPGGGEQNSDPAARSSPSPLPQPAGPQPHL